MAEGREVYYANCFYCHGDLMQGEGMFAHGLNERVPIKAFYDALDHWSIILRELAGDGWEP